MFIDYLPMWMLATLFVLLFSGLPIAFVLGGVSLLFAAIGVQAGMLVPIQLYNIVPRVFGGIAADVVLVAVPMFILMGSILAKSGIAEDLLYCLQVLLRRVPGGLTMSVTIMGTVLAATTGIVGASIVLLSLIALPTMLAASYSKELSTGTIAAAGCLGVLIPPSIMLVVMAEILQVPTGTLFLAAFFPGLLLSALYFSYNFLLCAWRPHLAPPLPESDATPTGLNLVRLIFRAFVPVLLLVGAVLGSIYAGWATPTEAAGVGCIGALALAAWNRRLRGDTMTEAIRSTILTNAMVFMIFIGATAFSYIFRALGGDDFIIGLFKDLGLGSWGILWVLMALVFVLGIPFEWPEISLIILPVFYPVLQTLDFSGHLMSQMEVLPWITILIAVNLQTSFLTPPYGFALFYLKGTVPREVSMGHIYRGVVPFVCLQLIGLGLCIAFPSIVLYLPRSAGFVS
ncbi:MAG: TRAP transporter large permease subunit [Alphaproteobacteria bacterium]